MIQCLVLCVVDTAILVVLSAGDQKMHSEERLLHLQAFNAVHPVIYFVCDPTDYFSGFTCKMPRGRNASLNSMSERQVPLK